MEVMVGKGVIEVVGVGRGQVVRVRIVVSIVVEEDGGYAKALRYSHPHVSMWGCGVVITAAGHPSPEVGSLSARCVGRTV